jgi:hypothetical protein
LKLTGFDRFGSFAGSGSHLPLALYQFQFILPFFRGFPHPHNPHSELFVTPQTLDLTMPTLYSDPEEDNYEDITLAGNVTEDPFVVVKNNKRTHAGQQPTASLTYNNPSATLYIEPHAGTICSSCNLQDKIYIDADGHFRTCPDRRSHVILSNGFIYENKVGIVTDNVRAYPAPLIFTGQDYRNVRDMCGISADLILRQKEYWTPSKPILEENGDLKFKSYCWHYNYMTKITGLRANQWGLPRVLYGVRHKAIIRSNSAQTNITEEITNAELAIARNNDAVAARQAVKDAKAEHKVQVTDLRLQLKNVRATVVRANRNYDNTFAALESMTALLATANERLRDNSLEEVTAKTAPISPNDVTGGTGDGSATTTPVNLFPGGAPITQRTPEGTD